jgi:hypothetical protein
MTVIIKIVKTQKYKHLNSLVYRRPAYNSTYKKLAVQWLNEALRFVSSFVLADSLVLRNPPLRKAENRQAVKKLRIPQNTPQSLTAQTHI